MRKSINVMVGGESRTLKMPYGMLTELLRITGCDSPPAVSALITDLYARDLVIRRLLTPDLKEPMVDANQLTPSFDLDIEPETVDEMIGWVLEHLLDYFVRSLLVLKATDTVMSAAAKASSDPSKTG